MPTSVVITAATVTERLDQDFEAHVQNPVTKAQIRRAAKTREAALSGEYKLFKTATRCDGTAQDPERIELSGRASQKVRCSVAA
jgi:hypothetical protein